MIWFVWFSVTIPACLFGSYLGELTIRWARKRRGERQFARMIYDSLDCGTVSGYKTKRATITFVIEHESDKSAAAPSQADRGER